VEDEEQINVTDNFKSLAHPSEMSVLSGETKTVVYLSQILISFWNKDLGGRGVEEWKSGENGSCASSASVYYCQRKPKSKMGYAWEQG